MALLIANTFILPVFSKKKINVVSIFAVFCENQWILLQCTPQTTQNRSLRWLLPTHATKWRVRRNIGCHSYQNLLSVASKRRCVLPTFLHEFSFVLLIRVSPLIWPLFWADTTHLSQTTRIEYRISCFEWIWVLISNPIETFLCYRLAVEVNLPTLILEIVWIRSKLPVCLPQTSTTFPRLNTPYSFCFPDSSKEKKNRFVSRTGRISLFCCTFCCFPTQCYHSKQLV